MLRLEAELTERRPDLVLVADDVNSTVAAALIGSNLRIPVAHVEAGLRNFDRSMPEETNRQVGTAPTRILQAALDPWMLHRAFRDRLSSGTAWPARASSM